LCPNSTGSLWRCGQGGTSRRRSGCSVRLYEATKAVTVLAPAAVFACWCETAQAYRPFGGTMRPWPTEYLREGAERVLFAPDLRANYGFAQDKEMTIEGDLVHALAANAPGT